MAHKYYLRYQSKNHNELLDCILGAGFEKPDDITQLTYGEDVFFSGWIIPKNHLEKVEWIVEHENGNRETFLLTLKRGDVLTHLSLNQSEAPELQGFSFSFPVSGTTSIFILVGARKIELWAIYPIDGEQRSVSKVGRLFQQMHERYSGVSPYEEIDNSSFTLKDCHLLESDIKLLSCSDFFGHHGHNIKNPEAVKDLFSQLRAPEWPLTFSTGKDFNLPAIFSDAAVRARISIAVHDFNFILFSNQSECFYLVQHCANVCLILPNILSAIALNDVTPWVDTSVKKIPNLIHFLLKNEFSFEQMDNAGEFIGFNISQSRPYHYYYDYLYGLDKIISSKKLLPCSIYSIEGFDFFDIGILFEQFKYSSISNDEINRMTLSQGGFLLMPCIQYCRTKFDPKLIKLSSKLRYAAENFRLESQQPFDSSDFDFVIWIGISNEKRSWLEQIEGYSNIICKLNERYSKICVLVDGRTYPLSPREADRANKAREDVSFNELKSKNPNTTFINLIGMTSIEKIYFAARIDCFISSYATDSIYPSAICHNLGVVFISPKIQDQRHLHAHHNIIEVASNKIHDIEPIDSAKSWHETSISMSWKDVHNCLLKILEFKR